MIQKKLDHLFEKAENIVKKEKINIENIGNEKNKLEDQNYAIIYYVTEKVQDKTYQMLKIWGTFATEEAAAEQAKLIKKGVGNEIYDIYIIQLYSLATRPPERILIKKHFYHEEKLQQMIKETDDQRLKVKEVFDFREDNIKNDKSEQESLKNELNEVHQVQQVQQSNLSVQDEIKLEKPPTHFDPDDDLTLEESLECLSKANKYIETLYSESKTRDIDLVKEDIRIPEQNWGLISFTGKDLKQKTENDGIIFWGSFDKVDDAKKHAKKLMEYQIDIAILEMYTWIIIPPSEEFMKVQEAHEDAIIKILKKYKRVLQYNTEKFEMRKKKLMDNPDMNQYYRFKSVLKDIKKEGTEVDVNVHVSQEKVKKLFDNVFSSQKKLPTFEIKEDKKQSE